MRKIVQITIILISCLCAVPYLDAQEQTGSLRERLARKQQEQQGTQADNGAQVKKMTVRAEMKNVENAQDMANATWVREVYRILDLTKGKNAALYYPPQPVGDKMNLYTMIFKLMADGNLTAYEWNDGRDLFVDELKVNFENVLKNLEIPYQKNGNKYTYDEFSIPGNEALRYYIKEAWYFDQSNSVMGIKVLAICPVLMRQEYFEGIDNFSNPEQGMPQPQFWIPYENIRPYAAQMPIMASNLNNVMNKTIDDYFNMRLYEGEIYKTTNMENKLLMQQFKTPEELKYAQDSIESQLKDFDKNLWVINDSVKALEQQSNTKKQKKQKAPKASKSSSSGNATYSARDRRW
ncbi:gliding motility associated protein GldN [Dysgonomonas hofstadii]|uniref:Gliding motility associated protein GldN n=1 Tax=Dysgonomonas hofstadii TaxID=637886 RepID=A0A840CWG2_9BACT|nr:gliding motility protein GldN [Dysgonomonas hofstadii]MBB4036163.1 gliding motility associated protein GldN [Dysgonomonas hofstadii]